MKATIESTWRFADVRDEKGRLAEARVWEGVTESGIPFAAFIVVALPGSGRELEFDRELDQSRPASTETLKAIAAVERRR